MKKHLDLHRVIAIIGLAKNTGKTTTLNAIKPLYKDIPIALTSIGLDGEALDAITNLPKPKIVAMPNEWIATAYACLKGKSYEIIQKTSIQTALGPIYIVRFKTPTEVVLAGPSTNKAMQALIESFPKEVQKVFIDGAFDKKTFASIKAVDAVVLSTGATIASSLEGIVKKTMHAIDLLTLPIEETPYNTSITIESTGGDLKLPTKDFDTYKNTLTKMKPNKIYLKGAVTSRYIAPLLKLKNSFTLVIDDMSKWLAGDLNFTYLKKNHVTLKVLNQKPLLFVTMSPFIPHQKDINPMLLKNALTSKTSTLIINVLESEEANE